MLNKVNKIQEALKTLSGGKRNRIKKTRNQRKLDTGNLGKIFGKQWFYLLGTFRDER